MSENQEVRVRMYGALHTLRRVMGLPPEAQVEVPDGGVTAKEVAGLLELPLDKIEGVFRDHSVHGLDLMIVPGDSIAFVPSGVPGPHRFTLGIYSASKGDI